MSDGICIIDQCDHPVKVKKYGWCSRHYQRWQLHGDPLAGRTLVGDPMSHYRTNLMIVTDECKIWPYTKMKTGYGTIQFEKKKHLVHVLACEAWHGPMPHSGMDAAHGPCHTPSCWNGAHLLWKDRKGNMADQLRDGTRNLGTRNGRSKITEVEVGLIRQRVASGLSTSQVGVEFDLSQSHVSAIINRRKWKYLQ
jgi:hypothetical protein